MGKYSHNNGTWSSKFYVYKAGVVAQNLQSVLLVKRIDTKDVEGYKHY